MITIIRAKMHESQELRVRKAAYKPYIHKTLHLIRNPACLRNLLLLSLASRGTNIRSIGAMSGHKKLENSEYRLGITAEKTKST